MPKMQKILGNGVQRIMTQIPFYNEFTPPTYCFKCGCHSFKEEDVAGFKKRWVCSKCKQGFLFEAKKVVSLKPTKRT
jgi:hypothetical protein